MGRATGERGRRVCAWSATSSGARRKSHQKKNGRPVVAGRPFHTRTIPKSELAPPFFSQSPPPVGRSGGRGEASVSIPRPDGRPTWFVRASAAGLAESRTDFPHCTPRRKIGADGARDWLHLSGSRENGIDGYPSPCPSVAFPEPPPGPLVVDPSPDGLAARTTSDGNQDTPPMGRRKCLSLFGLARSGVGSMWTAKSRTDLTLALSSTDCGDVDRQECGCRVESPDQLRAASGLPRGRSSMPREPR